MIDPFIATTGFLSIDRRHPMTTGLPVWWIIGTGVLAWAADLNSMVTALPAKPGSAWTADLNLMTTGFRWKKDAAWVAVGRRSAVKPRKKNDGHTTRPTRLRRSGSVAHNQFNFFKVSIQSYLNI